MASSTQAEHDALSVPQGVGAVSTVAAADCAQLHASEHGEIYRASLEHRVGGAQAAAFARAGSMEGALDVLAALPPRPD